MSDALVGSRVFSCSLNYQAELSRLAGTCLQTALAQLLISSKRVLCDMSWRRSLLALQASACSLPALRPPCCKLWGAQSGCRYSRAHANRSMDVSS